MIWLITAALGGLVLYLIHVALSKKRNYWKDRGVPYVPALPLVGNSLDMLMLRKTLMEQNTDIYNQFKNEKFVGYLQIQKPTILLRDLDLINQILIKDFGSFHDRGIQTDESYEPLSANLANLTGARWRSLRQKLTPTFTSGKLKTMFEQIKQCADSTVDFVKDEKEAMEARALMGEFTLNVIGTVAFGMHIDSHNAKDPETTRFVKMSRSFFEPSLYTIFKLFARMSFPKLTNMLKMSTTPKEVDDFFINLVKDTVMFRESSGTRRNDFLQLLMDMRDLQRSQRNSQLNGKSQSNGVNKSENNGVQSEKKEAVNEDMDADDQILLAQMKNMTKYQNSEEIEFTDTIIAAQSFIFITAGSETTAASLNFVLYELATHPEIQAKVHAEIDSVLGNQDLEYQSLKKMKTVTNVINETLRLFPPGGVLFRQCTEEYVIPGTDTVLEKGTSITIPVVALHRDPQYFPDPDTFNPARFEEEIPKGVFFPFGGGPRICIAMRLAMLEMEIMLVQLLRKYTVRLDKRTTVPLQLMKNSIFQHVKGGIWVHFDKRS